MKILAIEDEPNICTLLRKLLSEADIKISDFRCLSTLSAGIEEVKNFTPDIIFLDLKLPDSPDGTDSVKVIPYLKSIAPVLVLTGLADSFFVECLEAGAEDCLDKKLYILPSNMSFLAHAIARAKLKWKLR
jgi:DNA-binding response OmpR family regulator